MAGLGIAIAIMMVAPAAQAETITTYRDATVGVRGATYNAHWGTCNVTRERHAVRVNCDRDEQVAFRYHIGKPALLAGEYIAKQCVGANVERFGGSGDVSVTRNKSRVRVYVEGTFNGLIHRVWRKFVIALDTEVSDPSLPPTV